VREWLDYSKWWESGVVVSTYPDRFWSDLHLGLDSTGGCQDEYMRRYMFVQARVLLHVRITPHTDSLDKIRCLVT
jgi:hypothetical protein